MWALIGEQARYAGPAPSADRATTGWHYVSAISGDKLCLLLGPYSSHAEAAASVTRAKRFVEARDSRGHSYAYGTSRLEGDDPPPGRLNAELPLTDSRNESGD